MHPGFQRLFCFVSLLGAALLSLHAQATPPSSGDVTVRILNGLDSAGNRPGSISGAVVTKSTNAAIPRNTPAQVQLTAEPDGTLGVQLTGLTLQGVPVAVTSAGTVLAPDLAEQVRIHTRQPNAPRESVTGPRVFLPTQSVVRFTLTAPAAASTGTPAAATAASPTVPAPPLTWQPVKAFYQPEGPGNTGVALNVLARSGTRHGYARLAVNCTEKSNLSVHLLIHPALTGYKVDDYNSVSGPGETDQDALGSFNFDGTTTAVFLTGNSGDDAPVHLVLNAATSTNTLPGSFFAGTDTAKPVTFTIKPPDGKGTPTVIAFTTPADPAPLVAVAAPCLQAQAQQEAERKAKIVVSCPVTPGKHLYDGEPRRVPAGKPFDADSGDEGGATYYLNSPPLRPGQHAVLVCRYLPDGTTDAPKTFPAADRVTVPIPAYAAFCEYSPSEKDVPATVTCSRK